MQAMQMMRVCTWTRASPTTCHRGLLSWQLHALSKSNPPNTTYQTAALLDVAAQQQFGQGRFPTPTTHLTTSSTSWQQTQLTEHDSSVLNPEAPAGDSVLTPAMQRQPGSAVQEAQHSPAGQRHIHASFAALFCYLALITAATTNPDWYLDTATFGGLWGVLWAVCARLQPSANTVALLCLLPVMHLSGALGMYHWEIGNLSWDIIVHITNGFIGTLLFASALADSAAVNAGSTTATHSNDLMMHSSSGAGAVSGRGSQEQKQHVWQQRVVGVLKVTVLLLLSTCMVEVVEAAGGQLAGHTGEGIFLRGPGDFCTAALPCSEEVDSAKDMVDNCTGMMLALLPLATRGGSKGSTHA